MNLDSSFYMYLFGAFICLYIVIKTIKKLPIGGGSSSNASYIKKGDGTAQKNYDDKFKDPNPLTKDEKIELSWQFLYDITDTVLNRFSQEDKEAIHKVGHKLLDSGSGYEHVVEYGLKPKKKAPLLTEDMEKVDNPEMKR